MISAEGWVDWAIRKPDPTPSTNSGVNPAEGVVLHSAEGYENGLISVLNGTVVSWHFSNLKDGRLWQHYSITKKCWHSASSLGNERRVGVEHEGVMGEPLTEAQIATTVRLIQDTSAARGWTPERGRNLHEHRELGPTTCPNGRIPWDEILRRLEPEEDEMTTHLAEASWFSGRQFDAMTPAGEFWTMQASRDFDLPAGAKVVRFSYSARGPLRWFHGSTSIEAPALPARGDVFVVEAVLDGAGNLNFRIEGPVTIESVCSLAYS